MLYFLQLNMLKYKTDAELLQNNITLSLTDCYTVMHMSITTSDKFLVQ